jgi:S-formylglutathione hydrolase FrmB
MRNTLSRLLKSTLLLGTAIAVIAVLALLILNARHGPLPILLLPAPQAAEESRLVIVLPGIEDDLDSLQRSGIAAAIQEAAPDMDVLLAGATPAYYLRHDLVRRLHQEIVMPARARGVGEIWMLGMSMGGFGSLLYERDHPQQLSGLVLLAPMMGRPGLAANIAEAGGLAQWQAPRTLPFLHPDRVPVQLWQLVQSWRGMPQRAQRVWLACGADDSFLPAAQLIATALPQGHFLQRDGGHQRPVWIAAAREIFARID